MGSALSTQAQWTSAADKGGKLDFSKSNEALLLEILRSVEKLAQSRPREASVLFKRPFVWSSSLSLANFEALRLQGSDEYTFTDTAMMSISKQDGGDPHLSVTKTATGAEIRALNFKQLHAVLQCAGNKKIKEVQLCLEANQDPIATVMGPAFASVGSAPVGSSMLLEVHERLAREKARGGDGEEATDELDSAFRLMLYLNSLDLMLLQSSIKDIGQQVRLSPQAVEVEVRLLQQFSGVKDGSCLKEVAFTSDVAFSNGCRAPPWRQVLGDICYISVSPLDTEQITVVASTGGYYLAKGMKSSGEVDPERVGEAHSSLVSLLKSKSSAFASNISRQEFLYTCVEEADGAGSGEGEAMPQDAPESPQQQQQQQQQQELGKKAATPARTPQKRAPAVGVRRGAPTSTFDFTAGTTEPSDKWKSLGLTEKKYGATAQAKSPPKTSRSQRATIVISPPREGKTRSAASSVKSKSRMSKMAMGDADDTDSSSETSEEEDQQERRPESNADLPSEYWQIQKLIKYLKVGNQTVTVIALCLLMDFDLSQEASQLAVRDSGGLDLLINLLETTDTKCKIGTLKILREISKNVQTRTAIVDLGGLPMLVHILSSPNRELKCLAAETIANVAKFKRARRIVRQHGGIRKMVALIQAPGRPGTPVSGQHTDLDVATSAALGLWSCSKSKSNKLALLKTGAVPLFGRLLESDSVDVLIPVVGTLQECASERTYQQLIQSEGMIQHLVRGLSTENTELQKHCASAIFKCAEEEATRALVLEHGGLEPLALLLKKTDNKELLCAVTGAVWKCSKSSQIATKFKLLKAIEQLVSLLNNQPEEVLVNVVGALGECASRDPDNRVTIRKSGGVSPMVHLLTGTNQALLINTTKAVGACALESDSMIVIDKQDGVRLLWSLFKSPNPEVQACAAWAICPCIENAKDAGELVRSFVGGLELIVSLLKSPHREVLASVCAAIAKIAKDEENLGVITDHGVVSMLASLTDTSDDHLRRHLADAIARCCMWRNNRVAFGEANAVAPLVSYLQSTDHEVHRATARALHQLSKDPNNCITMHEASVVQPLLHMVGSTDEVLQEAAAGCIHNIRNLALANEKVKFK